MFGDRTTLQDDSKGAVGSEADKLLALSVSKLSKKSAGISENLLAASKRSV